MTTANPTANGDRTVLGTRLQAILLRQETILFFILIGGVTLMSFALGPSS